MPRIRVPPEYDGGSITMSGTADHHYGTRDSDIDVDDRRHVRNVQVREDSEGRYVGVSDDLADAVREYLGVTDTGSDDGKTSGDDSDAQPESGTSDDDADICGATLSNGGTCERPADECPYHSD